MQRGMLTNQGAEGHTAYFARGHLIVHSFGARPCSSAYQQMLSMSQSMSRCGQHHFFWRSCLHRTRHPIHHFPLGDIRRTLCLVCMPNVFFCMRSVLPGTGWPKHGGHTSVFCRASIHNEHAYAVARLTSIDTHGD